MKKFIFCILMVATWSSFGFSDNNFDGRVQYTYAGKKILVIQNLENNEELRPFECSVTGTTSALVYFENYKGRWPTRTLRFWRSDHKRKTLTFRVDSDHVKEPRKITKTFTISASDTYADFGTCKYINH